MQVIAHLVVHILINVPADDDLLDRYLLTDGVDTADNLEGRIIWRMPTAQRYLDDIAGRQQKISYEIHNVYSLRFLIFGAKLLNISETTQIG